MADIPVEYLLRVRRDGQEFTASIRQLAGAANPDVRAVVGVVSRGQGATEAAALVSAIANARIGEIPAVVHEVPRHGC